MADLSITAANVAVSASARVNNTANAGETITAGMSVYLKAADGRWWKAQCDGVIAESGSGVLRGIALHGSLAGQPLAVMEAGDIVIGATVTVGTEYYVSATAGGICPVADLASTNYLTIVGYAITTTVIRLLMTATGIQKA